MKTLLSFTLFALITTTLFAQHAVLVTPHWLNEHKADPNVVVIQVSFLKYEYDQEHNSGRPFPLA